MTDRKKKQFCLADMHCHLLPGVDDGARNMEDALSLLRAEADAGVRAVVFTPHYKEGRGYGVAGKAAAGTDGGAYGGVVGADDRAVGRKLFNIIFDRMAEVKNLISEKGLDITVAEGSEVFYFGDMVAALDSGDVPTMNGTGFVLVEFLPGERFVYIRNALYELLNAGYRPVLAHAERYSCLYEKGPVGELKAMGVNIQLNAQSVTGASGHRSRRFCMGLIKEQLADYISSDAHRHAARIEAFSEAASHLYKRHDREYIDGILFKNAVRDFELRPDAGLPG